MGKFSRIILGVWSEKILRFSTGVEKFVDKSGRKYAGFFIFNRQIYRNCGKQAFILSVFTISTKFSTYFPTLSTSSPFKIFQIMISTFPNYFKHWKWKNKTVCNRFIFPILHDFQISANRFCTFQPPLLILLFIYLYV